MTRWCCLLLLFFLLLLLALPAPAVVLQHDKNLIIGQDQVIDDDLVIAGGNVQMLGRVTGDLVVVGGTVTANGAVAGDVIAAGGTVNIYGPVGGSIYAAGGTINVKSTVGRNVVTAGGNVNVAEGSHIARDLAIGGGNVTFSGRVERDLLDSSGNLILTSTARVNRNLIAQTSAPSIAAGVVIGGKQIITQPSARHRNRGRAFAGRILRAFFFGIALLLIGLLFVAIAPRLTEQTEGMLKIHPWGSLLAGFLVLLVAPLAIFLIAITCLGLPLAVVLWSLYLSALLIAPIFVAILVGRWILREPGGNLYLGLLLGLLVVVILLWIPVVSFLGMLIILLLGLGALTLAVQARSAHPLFPGTALPATAGITEPPPEAPPASPDTPPEKSEG